jgi:hypothetical protein
MRRRLPSPWHADKFCGGYVVRDANGFAVAYVYGRSTEAEAMEAKQPDTFFLRCIEPLMARSVSA